MDRLHLVAAVALLALGACSSDSNGASSSRERVNAVQADPQKQVDPTAMCDVYHAPGKGPAWAWPKLTGAAPAAPGGAWQWINVWATWCKPCIEELPRLTAWRKQLGSRVAMHFVSADADDETVAAYRADHPATPDGARLAEPDAVIAWIDTLGVSGASLPVHIFVDPTGAVRCVRASSVEDTDFPSVDALLR